MMRRMTTTVGFVLLASSVLMAHCQVPCGVYTDDLRIKQILEDVQTIEKAMKSITELSAQESPNFNQLVRWVTTKEAHAQAIQNTVTEYFMTQRLKAPKEGADEAAHEAYLHKLSTLHKMLVAAMKTKQTTDPAFCDELRELVTTFSRAYFSEEDFQHLNLEHGEGHGD